MGNYVLFHPEISGGMGPYMIVIWWWGPSSRTGSWILRKSQSLQFWPFWGSSQVEKTVANGDRPRRTKKNATARFFFSARSFLEGNKGTTQSSQSTRWAPTTYKYVYNPTDRGYNTTYPFTRPFIGAPCPSISKRSARGSSSYSGLKLYERVKTPRSLHPESECSGNRNQTWRHILFWWKDEVFLVRGRGLHLVRVFKWMFLGFGKRW